MKIKALALSMICTMSAISAANAATSTVNGGTVHFVGQVVNAACAVDAASMDQTVQMGQVRTAKLNALGATGSSVGFNIVLNDCDTTVSTKAQVAFTGTTASNNNTALAVDGSASGNASGVGIQILDRTNVALVLDGATYSAISNLNDGTNTLPFQARYIATSATVSPGNANGEVTFKITYS